MLFLSIFYNVLFLHTAPSAPLNLNFPPGGVLNDSITLTWLPPQHPNGVVRLYQVQFVEAEPLLILSGDGNIFVNTADNTTMAVLSDLTPGTQYTFSVRAFTVAFGPLSEQLSLHTADGEDSFNIIYDIQYMTQETSAKILR